MIPYLIMIVVPFLFYFVELQKEEKKLIFHLNDKRLYEKSSLAVLVFFIILYLLLAFRDETIGRDLTTYKYYFQLYSEYSFTELFNSWQESLFRWIDWFIGKYTSDFQVYLAIITAITLIPIAYVYCKKPTHGYLKIILFVNMSTFIMLFSGLRQSLAMAIGMIAYLFVKKKKPFPFIIFAFIALLIHHSGFMVFFMYPLYHMRLEKKHLLFIVPGILTVLLFNKQIFGIILTLLSDYSKEYDSSITLTGAFGSLILFALFLIFTYVFSDEKKLDDEGFGLRNFLVAAVLLQCFAPLNYLAMRMNYYYILFIPLAIGKCLDYPKEEYKSLAITGERVMCVFFTVYFIYTTYISYTTGISILDTIPYIPFWAK